MNTSRFIVLEGIDGSGTTTQSEMLHSRLQQEEQVSHITCEPTRYPIGKIVRAILNREYPAHPETLAYLFAADRHDHLNNPEHGILKALSCGSWVIQDRYLFSSLAYQTLQCSEELVYTLNNNFPLPGITFFLDLPAETAITRLESRNIERDIFEHIELQLEVRKRYQEVFKQYADHAEIVSIDASRSRDEIHQTIWNHVSQRISIASP